MNGKGKVRADWKSSLPRSNSRMSIGRTGPGVVSTPRAGATVCGALALEGRVTRAEAPASASSAGCQVAFGAAEGPGGRARPLPRRARR